MSMANPSLRAILLLLGIALPAWGQSLRVQLTETRTQRPLTGALVDILDSTSAVAVQGVLGDGGRRAFRLPRHGTYRVRLRRIGYDPFVGAPVVVGPAGADFAQEVPGRRVVLAALTVSARAMPSPTQRSRASGRKSGRPCSAPCLAARPVASRWRCAPFDAA
jgi:hypothetical protein